MPRFDGTFTTRIGGCKAGSPLLAYLSDRFRYLSSEAWKERLDIGALAIDGLPARADSPIRPGQTLSYTFVGFEEPELPHDTRLLAREGNLAMVHKPAGLPVHKTGTIIFQTLARWASQNLGEDWAPLHRLDRETSGIVAFARGTEAFKRFLPEGEANWVKLYLAVVRGDLPDDQGRIDAPLATSPDDPIRSRMHASPDGKPALTLWWRISGRAGGNALGTSVIVAAPITGRKHQIRAHLAHLGCPIVGDKMYSGGGQAYLKRLTGELDSDDHTLLGASHHLLHAVYLSIHAPTSPSDLSIGLKADDFDIPGDFLPYVRSDSIRAWMQGPTFAKACEQAEIARQAYG